MSGVDFPTFSTISITNGNPMTNQLNKESIAEIQESLNIIISQIKDLKEQMIKSDKSKVK